MQFIDKLNIPGEHALLLQGRVGALEAVLTVPQTISTKGIAFLGHPHSLQGGSMTNKVVTTCARVCKELGLVSLRFNFRGVGLSQGEYDAGLGESEDLLGFVHQWQQEQPNSKLIFIGFSFGSYVVYRAASQCEGASLITIAPPVHHYDYKAFNTQPNPWLIIQPEADEVVPASLVFDFASTYHPPIPVMGFADTSHFFHGKLIALKERLTDFLKEEVLVR